MAGLCAPLSTLRRCPRGHLRMTRGRCGSLLLHRDGLAPSTPCGLPAHSALPLRTDIVTARRHVSKVPNSEVTGYHYALSTRYAAERSFPTVSGRPNCPQTSRSAAPPNQNTEAVIAR